MNRKTNWWKQWIVVGVYAAAMAWVEAAVVYYLRTMVDRIEPFQANPLPLIGGLGRAELVREAATMVMLATVGVLAGRDWKSRLGFSAIAFGIWDIFYYIFLWVMCGWPHSLLDWDLLFLLPLPWWGPVWAPVSIAALMILWGTLAASWKVPPLPRWHAGVAWSLNIGGVAIALLVFMADTLRAAGQGVNVIRTTLPSGFNWPLFLFALVLMAAPVLQVLWWSARRAPATSESPALDLAKWLKHFARNREHRIEPDWTSSFSIPWEARKPLLKSLEQFQLGDGGGPASLIAHDAVTFHKGAGSLREVVDLWFAEEREHSRLLSCAVARMGGRRIESHWSFTAFCQCRKILGVRFELQVLLLTEITSSAYYRLLQRHCKVPALEQMCALILRDEAGHIAFHHDRLAARGRSVTGWRGKFWLLQFCLCGYGAATMLWINHRLCLVRLGASTPEFYREVNLELFRFIRALNRRPDAADKLPRGESRAKVLALYAKG